MCFGKKNKLESKIPDVNAKAAAISAISQSLYLDFNYPSDESDEIAQKLFQILEDNQPLSRKSIDEVISSGELTQLVGPFLKSKIYAMAIRESEPAFNFDTQVTDWAENNWEGIR